MIRCKECLLQKKASNCQVCKNATGKLYLDFFMAVKALVFGPKNNNDRVFDIQDLVVREEEMINSINPKNMKEFLKL